VVDGTAKFIIESSLKYASLASTTIDASSGLTIPANTVRIFTAAAAPSGNVTVNGTAIFSGAAAPAENVTVNGTLTVSSTGSLTIDAGKTLANAGTVALTGTGSLVLTSADSTGGAKITGAGKVTAGLTEIVGGTSGWQAVGTHSSDVTIASVSAVAASITAATGEVFTAQGAGATITQLPGASNALTIAANTEINLAGNGTTAAGKITLVSGPDPAKLAFGATSSKVLAGAGAGGSGIGGVTTVTIGGKAIVNGGLVAADYQNANSKLVQLGGTTQGNFTASVTPDQDVVIDSTVVAAGS
jgi:hypothetical protein